MKAKLIKKDAIKPALRPKKSKLAAKTARRGGPAVDPRAAFAALFEKAGGKG